LYIATFKQQDTLLATDGKRGGNMPDKREFERRVRLKYREPYALSSIIEEKVFIRPC